MISLITSSTTDPMVYIPINNFKVVPYTTGR